MKTDKTSGAFYEAPSCSYLEITAESVLCTSTAAGYVNQSFDDEIIDFEW